MARTRAGRECSPRASDVVADGPVGLSARETLHLRPNEGRNGPCRTRRLVAPIHIVPSHQSGDSWRRLRPSMIDCRTLFLPQPGCAAFDTDRDGKRAFNIRAASPSFTLLFPILPTSRLA
jgi:hypothetical protein